MTEYIGYFSIAIIVIVIFVLVRRGRDNAEKEALSHDRMNFVVRLPLAYKVIGIVFVAVLGFGLVMILATAWGDSDFPLYAAVVTGLLLLGLFITLYTIRFRVVVDGNHFTLTSLFRGVRTYHVCEVTHIEADNTRGLRVYKGGKRLFFVDRYSVGCNMLISYFIENGVRAPKKIDL